jgi:hypothetical protein
VASTPRSDSALAAWFAHAADWPDAVLPDYDGGSNANLPTTISVAFGVPPRRAVPALLPPLRPEILDPAAIAGARVIVLLVLDGLGRLQLDRALSAGRVSALSTSQHATTLTSVFPSTTAAALTSLQTGTPAGVHGMAGYTLYLPAQRCVANMITWKPTGGVEPAAPMPEPRSFLNGAGIYRRLHAHGVESTHISRNAFAGSALTEAQAHGVPFAGHRSLAELMKLIRTHAARPGRRFIFAYWDGFDALGHAYGPESDACELELRLIDLALGEGLLDPLAAEADDVALLVTADHGHHEMPADRRIDLAAIPGLVERWAHRPTGELRSTGLRLTVASDRQRIAQYAGDRVIVVDAGEAIAAGLYGRGELHPELLERVGDTLLLARGDASVAYPGSSQQSIGGHGSLTAEEMLVLLLVWRFRR